MILWLSFFMIPISIIAIYCCCF